MKLKSYIFQIALAAAGVGVLGACEDMLEPTSEYVMYDDDHLNSPSDTASSLIGLIYKLEAIGDRTNLLGEVRGDLVTVRNSADADLQDLADFNVTDENKYNDPRDYYAIINNCNYYITHADMNAYDNRGNQIFLKEMAQVKAIRAWTYLQLALAYGKVPFYTEPLLTEQDAEAIGTGTEARWGIEQICDYFIEDLTPYVDTDWPTLHTIGSNLLVANCYFPVEVVLGDLYLWKATYSKNPEDYRNAARCYWGWITSERNSGGVSKLRYRVLPASADWAVYSTNVGMIYEMRDNYSQLFPTNVEWTRNYTTTVSYYTSSQTTGSSISWSAVATTANNEIITIIPMDSASSQGYYNQVRGLYNSSMENGELNDFSITPSTRMFDISRSQVYCNVDRYGNVDSLVVSDNTSDAQRGDLRLNAIWNSGTFNTTTAGRPDQVTIQTLRKVNQRNIPVYRQSDVWLRLAEALNNGGFPRFAYAILATGIGTDVVNDSILAYCTKSDSAFISEMNTVDNIFSEYRPRTGTSTASFESGEYANNFGIHSRGCGFTEVSPFYAYPMVDSVDVNGNRINGYVGQSKAEWAQMNLEAEKLAVDSMIIEEMALETCFEGKRFYDLIRWAERYNKKEWVAGSVSKRDAESSSLYGKLMDKNNWFLKWNNQIGME